MPQLITKNTKCDEDAIPLVTETALAALGCIFDEDSKIIGKVFLCKSLDTEGEITYKRVAFFSDGSEPISPYEGEWRECDYCDKEVESGFITQFN